MMTCSPRPPRSPRAARIALFALSDRRAHPHPDPLARAAFVGLTVRHGMAHLTRSVLEGVAFGLRDSMKLIRSAGLGEIRQVRLSGGGARSPLWRQILADVMATEMVRSTLPKAQPMARRYWPASARAPGAACRRLAKPSFTRSTASARMPRPAGLYARLYDEYRALYPALKPSFEPLSPDERSRPIANRKRTLRDADLML